MPSTSFFGRHDNVYLYVPNLIGYARLAFAFYGFAVASTHPGYMMACYALSFVCDELDGRFARMLGQTSTLGQVLDMVTDRVATSCLLATLCVLYPRWQVLFLALLSLDIFSHWFQMFSTGARGNTTHKDVESRSVVVRFYYRNRIFMGFCCVCCEVLYLALYALAWPRYRALAVGRLPAAAVRLLHPWVAPHLAKALARPISLPVAIAAAAAPGAIIKQFVNVIQLRNAADTLVKLDLEKRA